MERRIKHLKISLIIELIIGSGLAVIMGLFLGAMASDYSTSTQVDIVLAALLGFCLIAIPLVLLPAISIRELNRFPEKRVITVNYINSAILIAFVFFPVGIWQIFNLVKLKSPE